MFTLLFAITITGIIIGIILFVCAILEWIIDECPIKLLIASIVVLLVFVFSTYKICVSDPQRALRTGYTTTQYAEIKEISSFSIQLNDDIYTFGVLDTSCINEKYPLHLNKFKRGDVVKITMLHGDVATYLINIKKLK